MVPLLPRAHFQKVLKLRGCLVWYFGENKQTWGSFRSGNAIKKKRTSGRKKLDVPFFCSSLIAFRSSFSEMTRRWNNRICRALWCSSLKKSLVTMWDRRNGIFSPSPFRLWGVNCNFYFWREKNVKAEKESIWAQEKWGNNSKIEQKQKLFFSWTLWTFASRPLSRVHGNANSWFFFQKTIYNSKVRSEKSVQPNRKTGCDPLFASGMGNSVTNQMKPRR